MYFEDGDPEWWLDHPISPRKQAEMNAAYRNLLRQYPTDLDVARLNATRWTMACWLRGVGAEVGAGNRPVPVPESAKVVYGDIRDETKLETYFGSDIPDAVGSGKPMDAQTWAGYADDDFDFVISAHVIEHLMDPIGSLRQTLRVIKPGGLYLLIVPDMRYTIDHARPETPLDHLIADAKDGGLSTQRQAHEEIIRYVNSLEYTPIPDPDIPRHIDQNIANRMDIHYHAWTRAGFDGLLAYCETVLPMRVEAGVSVVNENQYMIRKLAAADQDRADLAPRLRRFFAGRSR